jgi:alkylhydroperoxidase family enzyme
VPDGHVSDEDFNAAAAVLTADQVSAIAWLAAEMNAFNRVATTSRYSVSG